jgi:hypothetical protein
MKPNKREMLIVKIDFYRVDTSNVGGLPFEDLLADLAAIPDNDQRNEEISGYPVRLSQSDTTRDYVKLDMTKIRMDEVPLVAGLDGDSREIELDDDEGIGEESAYLYHKDLGLLVAQRNRYGVSPSVFASYIQRKLDLEGPVAFDPVLTPNAYQRLQTMPVMRKFEIKLAGVNNPEMMVGADESLGYAMNRLAEYEAPNAYITFSMGHQHGSLNVQRILDAARSWLNLSDQNPNRVTALRVSGQDPDNEGEMIDLIADRFMDERTVTQDGRYVSWGTRITALMNSYRANQNELRTIFEVPAE